MPTIVLTGGGSGGHITPLLSLAQELKVKDPTCRILYIGSKKDSLKALEKQYQAFDEVSLISAGKFRRYHSESILAHLIDIKMIILNIGDFFKVLWGIVEALRILKKRKPKLVFSKGGFVGVPVGVAARLLKIPLITHDSDATPGLSNRIVGRWAKIHAVGSDDGHYDYPKNTIHYTGIPIDGRIKKVTPAIQDQYKKELGLESSNKLLLVAGGGLGSDKINRLLINTLPDVLVKNLDLHVVHIAGQKHATEVEKIYSQKMPTTAWRVKVVDFSDRFYVYSAAADLIITRAGATALAEFAAAGKACIVIPSPYLTAGHQLKNAASLGAAGAAEIMPEDTPPHKLADIINRLLSNDKKRQQLATKINSMAKPKASAELADLLIKYAK